jgi:hypothetical protein
LINGLIGWRRKRGIFTTEVTEGHRGGRNAPLRYSFVVLDFGELSRVVVFVVKNIEVFCTTLHPKHPKIRV